MDATTLVGSLAALATATSFVPQAWKVIRTRDTGALSAGMYVLRTLGILLWLVYGLLLGGWPLIATNSICLVLAGFILAMKLLPRRHREAVADALDPTPRRGPADAPGEPRPPQPGTGRICGPSRTPAP